jgi:hypothetical protein
MKGRYPSLHEVLDEMQAATQQNGLAVAILRPQSPGPKIAVLAARSFFEPRACLTPSLPGWTKVRAALPGDLRPVLPQTLPDPGVTIRREDVPSAIGHRIVGAVPLLLGGSVIAGESRT